MTTKPAKITLDDISRSIDGMQAQIGSMQTQINKMRAEIVTKDDLSAAIDRLVTKDAFNSSVSRLETTVRREAGDLGESIASLTNMVSREFDSLTITRLKPARLKTKQAYKNSPAKGC